MRVFADRGHGFALALRPSDAAYPAVSADGGRTWRVDGPILYAPPAGGPVAVDEPGVANPRFYFAWLSESNNVVDVTADAGRHWWQAFLPGGVLSVTASPVFTSPKSWLTAIVEGPTPDARGRVAVRRCGNTAPPTVSAGATRAA